MLQIITISDLIKGQVEIIDLAYILPDIFDNISDNKEIKVIIINDGDGSPLGMEKEPSSLKSISGPVSDIEFPVIAAINGDALNVGLELILACDIRISAETSRFGMCQIKQGLIPSDGGTQRLSRLIGRGKAMEMVLTGNTINANEALRIGLINRSMPQNSVLSSAMEMANEMASRGPISLR